MNLLSVPDAAEKKGISRQGMLDAVKRGEVSASKVGKQWIIMADAKFEMWQPAKRKQEDSRKR